MSDPLNGQPLPATTITPDVAIVLEQHPKVDFGGSIVDRLDAATKAQLFALSHGLGEPSQ